MESLKVPPYGKPLKDLLDSGSYPKNSVYLFIGLQAWKKGKAFSISQPTRTLVLPAYQSPFEFSWPVKCCDILIFDSGFPDADYIKDLVYCLYKAEAEIVRYISPEDELTVYHKE